MSHETTLIRNIRDAVTLLQSAVDLYEKNTKPTRKNGVWKVASRSGNRPHFPTLFDGVWTCSCAASGRGIECWAIKGVRSIETGLFTAARRSKFNFRDENAVYRSAEYLGES